MRTSLSKNSLWKLTLAGAVMIAPGFALAQGGTAPPFAGGGMKSMTLAEAAKQAPIQDKTLAPLAKAADAAEAKLKKSPKAAAAKKAYVDAAYKFGYGAEFSKTLPPPIRYRAALAEYRKALAVDPKHEMSLKEKTQIEEIYKGMGMPIPQK